MNKKKRLKQIEKRYKEIWAHNTKGKRIDGMEGQEISDLWEEYKELVM